MVTPTHVFPSFPRFLSWSPLHLITGYMGKNDLYKSWENLKKEPYSLFNFYLRITSCLSIIGRLQHTITQVVLYFGGLTIKF